MLEKSDLQPIKEIFDQSLDEKLSPIKQELVVVRTDLENLHKKVEEIKTMLTEDIVAFNKDVQVLN